MLQILSNYGNINNIENKQQANTMKTIRITLKDAKKLNLTWKLIGLWEICDESESERCSYAGLKNLWSSTFQEI